MMGLGCRRFDRLLNELVDREASEDEAIFLARHRESCVRCREEERAAYLSLGLLRGATFDTTVEDSFDRRVVRRARAQRVSDGVRYWSPALVGGLVAASLLLAAVQALTRPIAPGKTPPVQASRGTFRSLALKGTPHLSGQ